MGSFKDKLARLPSLANSSTVPSVRGTPVPAVQRTGEPPVDRAEVLEHLRERIARIVGSAIPAVRRADPTHGDLPFVVEHTAMGPLYVHRSPCSLGARVGRAPLAAARDADPAMLAMLALDPSLAGCDPRRALYLDTETTGLAGGTGTVPFLLGLAWYDERSERFMMEQALLRRLGEEAPILTLLAERLAEASMIVTYNGKAFDWPLLRTRFVMNRIKAPPVPPHLDLVHVARRIHGQRLKVRTLIAIENEVLGRERIGDIPGGEIVMVYAHFLRTGDDSALLGVVEHNEADVLAMVALVGLYGEPTTSLIAEDLVGAARTLRRAGALDMALDFADRAVLGGAGNVARRARGDISKARGDKARALLDYEAILVEMEDPSLCLELAKLYEHHVKAPARALELVDRGTSESGEQTGRRRARLLRKIERA
jgi:uncharacterized protein YprB with RNaseH-like and TPR domain